MSETTGKIYDLRPLKASDMGMICKALSKIGIREFKECFQLGDLKDAKENVEAIGFGVLFDIAGIIIEHIPDAEKEIQTVLASLTGMPAEEIKALPFADYGEMIIEVVTKDDFKDFFGRVMKLFSR